METPVDSEYNSDQEYPEDEPKVILPPVMTPQQQNRLPRLLSKSGKRGYNKPVPPWPDFNLAKKQRQKEKRITRTPKLIR